MASLRCETDRRYTPSVRYFPADDGDGDVAISVPFGSLQMPLAEARAVCEKLCAIMRELP